MKKSIDHRTAIYKLCQAYRHLLVPVSHQQEHSINPLKLNCEYITIITMIVFIIVIMIVFIIITMIVFIIMVIVTIILIDITIFIIIIAVIIIVIIIIIIIMTVIIVTIITIMTVIIFFIIIIMCRSNYYLPSFSHPAIVSVLISLLPI